MYCWPSVWHYVHRYVVLILMDKSSSISWGRGVRGFWGDHIFFRGKGGESLPNRSWGGRWGLEKNYEPTNCQWKGIIRLQSLIGELGKIYRDTNDILRKPPPLDKLWSVPFSTLVEVNVGFSRQTKKTLRFYKDLLLLQRIDENVHSQLREKNADRLQRLQRGYVECVFVCLFWKFFICALEQGDLPKSSCAHKH